ncbi:flavin reductase family protein [Nocardioides jiangxiensis]|uniref:Flavin reductase family protein n=1 Tax=Nocardioides jiangxiensis TaxID=3064524 RepID=A0ABT9AXR0_9ACTN|nr:flavin reductase family protein [Nocardioides sp. WY-20]MDO7867349.1 flavin reductase family protein [Nocardioides sp. WY-20]
MGSEFDEVAAATDPAMVVVTTAVGGERAGCLVGFHSQSSIDPPRYAIWLSRANHTYGLALRAEYLAIHFLGEDQLPLSVRFGTLTGDRTDKFAGLAVEDGPGGVPVLTDVPRHLLVRRVALLDEGGDHVCLSTEPVAVRHGSGFVPLRLSACDELDPGHAHDDRRSRADAQGTVSEDPGAR